jgi:hypothetical protein
MIDDWIENKYFKAFSFYHKKDNNQVIISVLFYPFSDCIYSHRFSNLNREIVNNNVSRQKRSWT